MPNSSSPASIVLLVQGDGSVEGLYSDDLDLEGARKVERASHVEYSESRGVWTVVDAQSGIELFSDARRADCLAFEAAYYNERLASGWSPFNAASREVAISA